MENDDILSLQKDFAQWILNNESFMDEYFDFNNEEDFQESLGYFSSQSVSLNREENEQESLFTQFFLQNTSCLLALVTGNSPEDPTLHYLLKFLDEDLLKKYPQLSQYLAQFEAVLIGVDDKDHIYTVWFALEQDCNRYLTYLFGRKSQQLK